MKFAAQLRSSAVEEWRRAYIDYRLLKKLIKAAANSEEDGENGEAEDESEAGRPLNLPSPPDSSVGAGNGGHASSSDEASPHPRRTSYRNARQGPSRVIRTQSRSSNRSNVDGLRRRKVSRPASLRDARWRYPPDLPLDKVVAMMNPQERKFFEALDKELEKVEAFYEEREAEAIERCKVLREQLDQLAEHRAEYLAKHSAPSRIVRPLLHQAPEAVRKHVLPHTSDGNESPSYKNSHDHSPDPASEPRQNKESAEGPHPHRYSLPQFNPENYVNARRKLKLATFETYKYLGYVKNYRLLNRTGFSKATKKMEKMSRIKCQAAYAQKVEKSILSSSSVIDDLQSQVESLFGASFEKGSRKKAIQRLRYMGASTNHHFASWRAGVMLGLAIPAFIHAIVRVCQDDVRARLPQYPSLLQLYGAMGLPPLLAFGIGINLLGWHRAHINVPLVFYYDSRTMVDFRQYLEIPSLLICTLTYCLWLSINVVSETVSPQVWPLVWLFSTIAIIFNPAPVFHKSARWWIIRSTFRVFTAGLVRVEFRDFWLGDQFVSLYYTSYNLGFIVCTYTHHWRPDVNTVCSTNGTWASAILASLPSIWRLGQSLRRYHDSREVKTHLVNAGKYAAGILYYVLYFNWRIKGSYHSNAAFALFIVFATFNSTYSLIWDLLMDWNFFRRNSRHRFLRNELGYTSSHWFYYFAMVTNTILRYSWVIYTLPNVDLRLKGFLVSVAETLRRWQWNFIRVESEHVGNVDGFRVTRDVPLPYTIAHDNASASASIAESMRDEDEDEAVQVGKRYRKESEPSHELGMRKSTLNSLLPGEMGKRLKTAVWGRKAVVDEESDDEEEDSPTEGDRRHESAQAGRSTPLHREASGSGTSLPRRRLESETTAASTYRNSMGRSQKNDLKNYNTFGFDSDVEGVRAPEEAHNAR